MYPRSFLCEGAKIKQRTLLKKELCEIGEEAIWESRFTSFFLGFSFYVEKIKAEDSSDGYQNVYVQRYTYSVLLPATDTM